MFNYCFVGTCSIVFVGVFQSNSFPERDTIFDYCFQKKASGHWIPWMDTLATKNAAVGPGTKVSDDQVDKLWTANVSMQQHANCACKKKEREAEAETSQCHCCTITEQA